MKGVNWVDVVILLLMGSIAFHGFWRGLVRETLDLVGLFLVLWLGYRFSAEVGWRITQFLGWNGVAAQALDLIGFFAIMVGVGLLMALANGIWESVALEPLDTFNHICGGVLGLIKGAVVTALLLILLQSIPLNPLSEGLSNSQLAPPILGAMKQAYTVMEEKWPRNIPQLPQQPGTHFPATGVTPTETI